MTDITELAQNLKAAAEIESWRCLNYPQNA